MSKLDKIKGFLLKKKYITTEIKTLEDKLKEYTSEISDIANSFTREQKRFIDDKIIENFTERQKAAMLSYRDYLDRLNSGILNSYMSFDGVFDPYHDSYNIVSIENEYDKIKITVTPTKPSGSISGLYTFFDMYTTVPFTKEEFENI
jgi:hypothetical protein